MPVRSRISERAVQLGYKAQRGATFVAARESIMSLASESTIKSALGGAAAVQAGTTLGGVFTVGAIGGLSAYLTIKDYDHRLDDIRKLYEEECAAQLGKSKKQLTNKDLDILAKGDVARGIEPNHTLGDQLKKERRRRNFDIVFSVIGSLAAFALVHFAVAGAVVGMPLIAAGLIKGAVGFGTYLAVKKPMHYVAGKMFNVDRETTHDRIVALGHCMQKGMNVGRDHVLSVFVSANPDLDRFIENRFGGDFETLDITHRARATDLMAQYLPIDQLTKDINDRKVNVGELAFAVQGEKSGVEHKDLQMPKQKKGLAKLADKMVKVFKGVEEAPEVKKVEQRFEQVGLVNAVLEPTDGVPERSWVEHVGGKRAVATRDAVREVAHVQRLEDQAAAATLQQGGVPG